MTNIVPFGKYRGQPVEALAADRDYCDWLMGQAWFRERYGNVYTLIINNFAEPSETPEHNALQARFLDQDFCRRLLRALLWEPIASPLEFAREMTRKNFCRRIYARDYRLEGIEKEVAEGKKYQAQGWPDPGDHNSPFAWGNKESRIEKLREFEQALADAQTEIANARAPNLTIKTEFEVGGWDVVITAQADGYYISPGDKTFLIEVKPSLGDDYPAILRQMKAYRRPSYPQTAALLVFDQFSARGASIEQVRAIFAASGLSMLAISEIEQVSKSSYVSAPLTH
jgi:hypothetical protein